MTLTTLHLSKSGASIAYQDKGKGAPLLLIHGVGMQSAAWTPQIEGLQREFQVIAVDMPGHGGSDPLPAGSELPDFVAWCHDVIMTLDLGPVNLAGHSMGALIAGGYTVTHPENVLRVALLNGVYRRDKTASAAVISRAAEIRAGQIDLETPLARWFGTSPTDVKARAQVSQWLTSVDPTGYGTAYAAFAHGDATYADRLSNITCPLLALTGDGDQNSTPAMSVAMAAQAQEGEAVIIQEHRHMVNLTAPEQVNSHLRAWLQKPNSRKEAH